MRQPPAYIRKFCKSVLDLDAAETEGEAHLLADIQ